MRRYSVDVQTVAKHRRPMLADFTRRKCQTRIESSCYHVRNAKTDNLSDQLGCSQPDESKAGLEHQHRSQNVAQRHEHHDRSRHIHLLQPVHQRLIDPDQIAEDRRDEGDPQDHPRGAFEPGRDGNETQNSIGTNHRDGQDHKPNRQVERDTGCKDGRHTSPIGRTGSPRSSRAPGSRGWAG